MTGNTIRNISILGFSIFMMMMLLTGTYNTKIKEKEEKKTHTTINDNQISIEEFLDSRINGKDSSSILYKGKYLIIDTSKYQRIKDLQNFFNSNVIHNWSEFSSKELLLLSFDTTSLKNFGKNQEEGWVSAPIFDQFNEPTNQSYLFNEIAGIKNSHSLGKEKTFARIHKINNKMGISFFENSIHSIDMLPDERIGYIFIEYGNSQIIRVSIEIHNNVIIFNSNNIFKEITSLKDTTLLNFFVDMGELNPFLQKTYSFSISKGEFISSIK